MVSTRSGFNSDGPAPASKGCCKRFLREFFLTMVDLCILMIGILKAPMTMRVIVALVLRLFLYVTNAVALYALTATVIHNGRPAHPLGEDQFVADLVNALLQPAQYANVQDSPVSSPRLKRSPDFPPHDLTPAEFNILKAILQEPIQGFPSLKSATMTTSKPVTPPTERRMVSRQVTAISTAPSRPGRAIPSTTTSPVSKATSDPPTPAPAVTSTTTSPVPKATSDPPTPAPAAYSTTTLTSSNPSPSTWSPAPPQQQIPAMDPPVYGLTAWLHQIQPVLMFSVLMVALSVTVCVSQIGGSLACGHLAAGCLPRLPATTASSTTRPVAAAPLHSSA